MIIVEKRDDILSDAHKAESTITLQSDRNLVKKQYKSKYKAYFQFIKSLNVEPFVSLFMLSYCLGSVCSQNLFIEKACMNVYLFPPDVCNNLDNHTEEKQKVETCANNYNLYYNLIQTIPAIFFSMVFGSWSDKYGRKLPVIFALFGLMLENMGLVLNVTYFSASINFILFSSFASGIFGGVTVITTCMYSLVFEKTTHKNCTLRYALLEFSFGVSVPVGTVIGGIVYQNYGYIYVYLLSMTIQTLSALYLIFLVRETADFKNVMTCKAFSDLFCFDNFKQSYQTVLKHRPNGVKLEIWLLIGSICSLVATYTATNGFEYYFTKWMYKWDVTIYSNVSSVFMTIGMLSIVISLPLFIKLLKMNDVLLGIIGSISMISSYIIKGLAYEPWIYYIGESSGVLGNIGLPAIRSRLSKIVSKDELGKIFAFVSSCESLVPVFGSLIFTQIFNASIQFFPGMAYIIAGSLVILPIIVFLWISYRKISHNESVSEKPDYRI